MDEEYRTQVKVPRERIAVVIGKKGETKSEIESATGCKLQVNTKENLVSIYGNDPLKLFDVQQIIKAIARGFNPKKAMLLLKSDYVLEIIELRNLVKKGQMVRVKGRVIGEEGKCRELIEHLTESFISVYGKTISIIGRPENVMIAKRAVLNLVHGSPHSNVYKWLEKKRTELSARELLSQDYLKEGYKDE
ncbi:RNA-processing protein [Candidatus Woesearchaeota archaeon]|jgi:ribosomal RNA assembly protein|nr:KH domain-containing protein [Candidatus Woesearchaeota archaeon]RLE42783.1 MAG: RNA-processing protein [Candidatus Woesearchaeota archaeon]